ncbi:MAG: hypothetical protein ACTSWN_16460 [Promethearchaeota archaeon]
MANVFNETEDNNEVLLFGKFSLLTGGNLSMSIEDWNQKYYAYPIRFLKNFLWTFFYLQRIFLPRYLFASYLLPMAYIFAFYIDYGINRFNIKSLREISAWVLIIGSTFLNILHPFLPKNFNFFRYFPFSVLRPENWLDSVPDRLPEEIGYHR